MGRHTAVACGMQEPGCHVPGVLLPEKHVPQDTSGQPLGAYLHRSRLHSSSGEHTPVASVQPMLASCLAP